MTLEQIGISDPTVVRQGEDLVRRKDCLILESYSQKPQPQEPPALRRAAVDPHLNRVAEKDPDEITAQREEVRVERNFLIPNLEDLPGRSRQVVQAKIDEIRAEADSLKRLKTETAGIDVPGTVEGNILLDDTEIQASEQLKQELQVLEQMHKRLIIGELKEDVNDNQNAVKRLLKWGRKAINKKGYDATRQARLQSELRDFNQSFDALSQRMKEFLPRQKVEAELKLLSESDEGLEDDNLRELIQVNRGQLVTLASQTDHALAKEKVLRIVFSETKLTKLDLSIQTGKVRTTVELKRVYSGDCEYPAVGAKQRYESEQSRMLMIEQRVLKARSRKALQLRESVNALFTSTSDRYGETAHAHVCEELISACHELSIALGESGRKGLMSDSHIEDVVRVQVGINKRIGESTAIMYHNGSVRMLGAILTSGGLKSHAQLLAEGRSFAFTTAGGFKVSGEGIEHNGRVITWREYRENGLGVNTNKDPLMEHHQILLSHEGPYYKRVMDNCNTRKSFAGLSNIWESRRIPFI